MNPEQFIKLFEPAKQRFETLLTLAYTHTAGGNELEELYYAIDDLEEDLTGLKDDIREEMEQQDIWDENIAWGKRR